MHGIKTQVKVVHTIDELMIITVINSSCRVNTNLSEGFYLRKPAYSLCLVLKEFAF